jgi:cobalt-zinc-cadmium efflux system outer membrane protein
MSAVLDLQIVMGLAADQVAVTPVDSLVPPPASSDTTDGVAAPGLPPLQVAAAQADVEASRLNARLQRRSIFSGVSLMAGVEQGDPDQTGLLPTFGISLPIPLFNRNRGPIMQAQAEQQRAQAALTLAEVETRIEIARARRELAIANANVQRDRLLLSAANRVAAMSLTAYREGAAPLTSVIEAQRSARDILATYIEDVANAWIFAAELRVRQLTPDRAP